MSQVIISYIPAIHQGYLNFFRAYPGRLYVLGRPFVLETPRLERDIRALEPIVISKMVRALKLMEDVDVLTTDKLAKLKRTDSIVMPDEDVNRTFAANHLSEYKVKFIPVFLRWDGHNAKKESIVQANQVITTKQLDRKLMNLALKEAASSPDWWRQIGAVIALDGKPILIGHNRPLPEDDYWLGAFGDPRSNFDYGENIELTTALHAEAALIARAAKKGLTLDGTSIYVSTFPCPVCAKLIAAAGIKHVFYDKGYSLLDAEDILKSHGVELVYVV